MKALVTWILKLQRNAHYSVVTGAGGQFISEATVTKERFQNTPATQLLGDKYPTLPDDNHL